MTHCRLLPALGWDKVGTVAWSVLEIRNPKSEIKEAAVAIPNSEFRIQNSLGHDNRVFTILVVTGASTNSLVLEGLVKSDCVEV